MTAGTITPYRSERRAGRAGFPQLLRAEWTKFRTVRGWVLAMTAAALVIVALGLIFATGSDSSCSNGPVEVACPVPPTGPDGESVDDRFFFVHQSMTGDGGIIVRLTSMSGIITYPPPGHDKIVSGLVPWAKAGVIVKDGTRQGSAYAAMMVTADHGVRMQYDYTHDTAGRPSRVSATSSRWLRLTRSGDTLTGYESADGTRWSKVGTTRLPGLPATVQIGLFVTSPNNLTVEQSTLAGSNGQARYTQATAVFDHVALSGTTPSGRWSDDEIGVDGQTDWERYHRPSGVQRSGGAYTVTGSGDIAPRIDGQTVERLLIGMLAGLIVVIVVAVMFMTAEYRRGLIHTTLSASPRRGRMLAAKAVVISLVTFAAGLAAAAITIPSGMRIMRHKGDFLISTSSYTELRVIVGTAALLAVTAVFALALGALFQRSVPAIITAIAAIVVPYVLAIASVLPDDVTGWLLRLTPAAGFAIQQSAPVYKQMIGDYTPSAGYFPLAPWAGFAVLCAYAALALGLAAHRLRRRDA
ncbi:hypothetical protein GCM10029978_083890 [Actinoallomurus acanthiterrae]